MSLHGLLGCAMSQSRTERSSLLRIGQRRDDGASDTQFLESLADRCRHLAALFCPIRPGNDANGESTCFRCAA